MKKLTRILALSLALLMCLGCCSFAENTPPGYDSTIYQLSILDPVIYANDTPMIDLTGANLDLSLAATDTGLTGLIADLCAGTNYDYITGLTAQLDPTGITAYLDGMSNAYNADISMLTGINPYFFMSQVPLRTTLNTMDFSAAESDSFTPEMRVAAAAELFSAICEEPEDDEYPISITAEEGRVLLEALADYIAQVDAATAQEYRAALAEDPELSFTLEGSMTFDGSRIDVDAEGALIDSITTYPVAIHYQDDTRAILFNIDFTESDGEEILSAELKSLLNSTDDGRPDGHVLFSLSAEDEDVLEINYFAEPAEDSAQVDHSLTMTVPDEEFRMRFTLQTGIHPEGVGFNIDVTVNEDEELYGFGLKYLGDNLVTEDGFPYHSGALYTYAGNNHLRYALELGLMMQKYDAPSSDWALPTEGTIDALSMDEAQQQNAMMEAMGVMQGALPALMEGVPGLGALLGSSTMAAE